jgi:hypothetical protein
MLALAVAMTLYGGATLISGLLTLRDPKALAAMALNQGQRGRTPLPLEVTKKVVEINHAVLDRYRGWVRANGIVSVAYGLYGLYAVAAVLSRDRHGRALAVGMAAIGIVHQVATLPLAIRMAHEVAAEVSQAPPSMLPDYKNDPGRLSDEIQALVAFAVIEIGWCVLILVSFAGRRGRVLYGLEPEAQSP